MREIKTWTLEWTLADAFTAWLTENGFTFESYEYGALYKCFEVEVNEDEEEEIDTFLFTDGLYEYMGVDPDTQYVGEAY